MGITREEGLQNGQSVRKVSRQHTMMIYFRNNAFFLKKDSLFLILKIHCGFQFESTSFQHFVEGLQTLKILLGEMLNACCNPVPMITIQ